MTHRVVMTGDALKLLPRAAAFQLSAAVVTSIPDPADVVVPDAPPCFVLDYDAWYRRAVAACLDAVSAGCPAVFVQTDRIADGVLYPKAVIAAHVALNRGMSVVWHRIILRRHPGGVDVRRPAYTHAVCVGRDLRRGKAAAEVYPYEPPPWRDGAPDAALAAILGWVAGHADTVIDPFAGHGQILAHANAAGMDAVGIEVDPVRADMARAASYQLVIGGTA